MAAPVPVIVGKLRDLAEPIDSLVPLKRNPRRGDVEVLKGLLRRFGQRKPITVRAETREITAGNHLWTAAKELGMTEIAAVVIDEDEASAIGWALGENRSNEVGTNDQTMLDELLAELAADAPDLIGVAGYDLDSVLAELNLPPVEPIDADGVDRDFKPYSPPVGTTVPGGDNDAGFDKATDTAPLDDAYGRFGDKADRDVLTPPKPDGATKVIFQFGDLRCVVDRVAYDAVFDKMLRDAGTVQAAGVATALTLGIDPRHVEAAVRA